MTESRNLAKAQRMFDSFRLVGAQSPVTVERIAAIIDLVDRLNTEHGVHLNTDSRWLTLTDEEITTKFLAQIKHDKKRAGVKGLVKKYGQEAAERILEKHTGRHINIR